MKKKQGGNKVGSVLLTLCVGIAGAAAGYYVNYRLTHQAEDGIIMTAERQAKKIRDDAKKTAAKLKKDAILAAREEILKTKNQVEEELKSRRAEVTHTEERVALREETISKKAEALEQKEEILATKLRETNELSETLKRERTLQEEEMTRERNRQTEDLARERKLQAEDLARKKAETEKDLADHAKEAKAELAQKTAEAREALAQKTAEAEAALAQKTAAAEAELQQHTAEAEAELVRLREEEQKTLETIAGMTAEQAKEQMVSEMIDEIRREQSQKIAEMNEEFQDEADAKAKNMITLAIQRIASDQVSETTVSSVALPSDDMKGRIIGREGRNIRSIEQALGVDLIIDDTPETITISAFDPIRREIARIALEKLISDGRIHPTRIEEIAKKAEAEVETAIRQAGTQAVYDTGVRNIPAEMVKCLGRLKYRTSYGQNVLAHSMEVAYISGIIADELGVDTALAKRAGLLHDIGKGMTQEVQGSHVNIGVDILKRFKESPEVIHAVEAHHGDVEAKTLIAMIVQAADAISAARPGARRENMENYIQRLTKLEEIANSFEGIEKAYAIQAGRELRIMVKPDDVHDDQMPAIAREIAQKIENELEYPGQVKICLIRENRVQDLAK